MTTLRIAVHGARGRMGRAVLAVLDETAGVTIVGAIDRGGGPLAIGTASGEIPVTTDLRAAIANSDVVIDFSTAEATRALAEACVLSHRPIVVGTTALDEAAHAALSRLALTAPVLVSPNMSVGVHVLAAVVREAVAKLGPAFDVEVVEMHHRAKTDAPSGTALLLARTAAQARGGDAERTFVTGRSGRPGARGAGEIGVLAMRGGDVIGDHRVTLAGPGELVELSHRATSRDVFARGAVRAAMWIVGRPPGFYAMNDVIADRPR